MEKDTQQASAPVESTDSAAKLQRLEELLAENEKLRSQRLLVSRGGLILVLIGVLLFAYNLYNVYTGIVEKPEAFAKEAMKAIKELPESEEVKKIQKAAIEKALPIFKEELKKQFEAELPAFKKEGEEAIKNMEKFLLNDVRGKVMTALLTSLEEIEKDLLANYPDLNAEDVDKVVKEAQKEFKEAATDILNKHVNRVQADLDSLSNTFALYGELPEYKELDPKNLKAVEHKLYEALLELLIYEINPKRGDLSANGGVK